MKRIISFLLLVTIVTISLASCSGSAERYELVDMDFPGVSVEAYEYNYIEFNEKDKTYTLENEAKQNNVVTKQTGSYTVDDDGYITFTNDDNPNAPYILYSNEKCYFQGDCFYAEANIPGIGKVSMTFSK
ncbi:MAG: hypothetical protein IKB38_06740 [Clostridia bacterium]|nr:hypothetical protein [Clostridia bacterium]